MPVETFNYIDSLNTANPTATDNVSEGDDHIRGVKTTLKNTFPNVTGAVTPTQTELNFVDGVTSAIQTQLDGKEPADATILKDADIGVTVQAYDAQTAKTDVAQTFTATQSFGDNVKTQYGAGNDLQVYHDGSNSYIKEVGTGNLTIEAATYLTLKGPTATMLSCQSGAGVSIKHNGSEKLITTATGIDVTGDTTTDSLTIQGGITESQVTNAGTTYTIDLTAGTIFNLTSATTCTVTMPTAAAGKSFTIIAAVPAAWSGTILWSGGAAPTGTGKCVYTFVSNGTSWYGMEAGSDFA